MRALVNMLRRFDLEALALDEEAEEEEQVVEQALPRPYNPPPKEPCIPPCTPRFNVAGKLPLRSAVTETGVFFLRPFHCIALPTLKRGDRGAATAQDAH